MVSAVQAEAATETIVKAKSGRTVNIPVHFLRQGHRTPVLRVYERPAGRRAAHVVVYVPAYIRGDEYSKGLEFTMGSQHDITPTWKNYVTEYLSYAVSKWYTIEKARKWVHEYRHNFVSFLNSLFDDRGFSKVPVSRRWSLRPSKAPPIEKYVVNHDFPTRSRHDPGFGVFSNVKGGPVVSFSCKDKRIAYLHDKKNGPKLTRQQEFYQAVGGTEVDPARRNDFVWVPTMDALRCRVIPEGMIVNSCQKPEQASHELLINEDGTTDVVPKTGKTLEEGEEVLFYYNYDDDETGVPDPVSRSEEESNTPPKKKARSSKKRKTSTKRKTSNKKKKSSMNKKRKTKSVEKTTKDFGLHVITDPKDGQVYNPTKINKGSAGDCLFVALEDQLDRLNDPRFRGMSHPQLRLLSVDQQRGRASSQADNPLMIRISPPSRTEVELQEMAKSGTYADDHEISALAKGLNINIRICTVRQDGTKAWVDINHGKSVHTLPTVRLCLQYFGSADNRNHYLSMRGGTEKDNMSSLSKLPFFATIAVLLREFKFNVKFIPGVEVNQIIQTIEGLQMTPRLVIRWVDDDELSFTRTNKTPMYVDPTVNDVLNVGRPGKNILYSWSTRNNEGVRHGKELQGLHSPRANVVVYVAGAGQNRRANRHIAYGGLDKMGRVVFKEPVQDRDVVRIFPVAFLLPN